MAHPLVLSRVIALLTKNLAALKRKHHRTNALHLLQTQAGLLATSGLSPSAAAAGLSEPLELEINFLQRENAALKARVSAMPGRDAASGADSPDAMLRTSEASVRRDEAARHLQVRLACRACGVGVGPI